MGTARSLKEMELAAELVPCPSCGTRDASTLSLRGGGKQWFLQGACPKCGAPRTLRFETAGDPSDVATGPFDLGPGASQVIRPAELLELYDRVKLQEPVQVASAEWSAAVAQLRRARTCINELAKLVPDGAAAIPATSDLRLTRAWIDGERARLDDLQQAYTAARPRIERDERANAPAKPVGSLSDSALRAHAQWLSRGRRGEGRLVLEHHELVGRRMGSPSFEHARFADCNLTDAVFDGVTIFDDAELERVTFARAHLETATFKHTTIIRGDWTDAKLARTNWTRVKIAMTDLSRSDLTLSVWAEAVVMRTNLVGATLVNGSSRGARFVDCDLRDSDWTGRTTLGTAFVRCNLAGARGLDRTAATFED